MSTLDSILIIFVIIIFFNFMIFVHELGHFLAGRWRGAYIDRFQIWFGKPIWEKKINGVKWGIGWIPAGGFVSLPQMGDMEAIEGEADIPKGLKPLSGLDKVIIAAAGPIFSLALAFFFAFIVWGVGKPADLISNTVGYVAPNSPAARAGIIAGDKIVAIDGDKVEKWAGNMEGVAELIATSEQPNITLDIERPLADGSISKKRIQTAYELPSSNWWQRTGLRRIGISPLLDTVVGSVHPGSPAEKAGLQAGDRIVAVKGVNIYSPSGLLVATKENTPVAITVLSPAKDGKAAQLRQLSITAVIPSNWKGKPDARPVLGIQWASLEHLMTIEHPNPWTQVTGSIKLMGDMLSKIASPGSNVGMEHLSGPIGIGDFLYQFLSNENGWRLVLWFAVILNVNLAVLNILPLPIVDGGHVVLGTAEMITGRPVRGRILEWVQMIFLFLVMGFFLFVTFKDIGDIFGRDKTEAIELPAPSFK